MCCCKLHAEERLVTRAAALLLSGLSVHMFRPRHKSHTVHSIVCLSSKDTSGVLKHALTITLSSD